MSEQPEVVAPEADLAVPETVPDAPGDAEAVDTESAELRKRFNGLMAAHQRALDALTSERDARLQAEARLQEGQTQVSDIDNETLTEVQALRQELRESKLAAARAEALRQYPDAEPFGDLLDGNTPSDILNLARAYAERAARIKGSAATEPEPEAEEPVIPAPAQQVTPGSVTVPMAMGGNESPGILVTPADALAEARKIAIRKPESQDAWDAFFASTVTPDAAAGLA